MSISLKNVAICENVIVGFDGKISLINMFSEVSAKDFPALIPKVTLLISITGDNGPHSETVEILSQDGKVFASVTDKADIQGPGGNNFVANFVNVQFPLEGQYWIKVTVDGQVITNKINHFILVKKV